MNQSQHSVDATIAIKPTDAWQPVPSSLNGQRVRVRGGYAQRIQPADASRLNRLRILPAASALLFILALSGCSKTSGDHSDAAGNPPEKVKTAETQPGLVLDAATQTRLGLQMETPAPAQWQPVIHATGRVANPLALLTAATDYEAARTTAAASQAEWQRTQRLAAQDNASPRTLEGPRRRPTRTRDALALVADRARFTADWGPQLAAQTNLIAQAEALQTGGVSLAKLFLPAGVFPDPRPRPPPFMFSAAKPMPGRRTLRTT